MRLAVATSVVSKLATAGVQLLAIPVLVRALGVERYGVFLVLTASLAWVHLAGAGLLPGLVVGIARADASGDGDTARRYLSTSFFLVLAICLPLLASLLSLVSFVLPARLPGSQYAPFAAEVIPGLQLLSVLLVLQVVGGVFESARAGYQEQHVNNLWMAAGNAATLGTLLAVALISPGIVSMIAALYGPPVLARLANGVHLAARRAELRPSPKSVDPRLVPTILSTGAGLFLVEISSFLSHHGVLVVLGFTLVPADVGTFGVAFRLLLLATGMVVMFTQPLTAALIDAVEQDHFDWVAAAFRRLRLFASTYAMAFALLLATAGPALLTLYAGAELEWDRLTLGLMGGWFVLLTWAHVHHTLLVGLGRIWWTAVAHAAYGVLVVLLVWWFSGSGGTVGAGLALCVATAVTLAWALPSGTRGGLRASTAGHRGPSPV